jgi:hypothetical protein
MDRQPVARRCHWITGIYPSNRSWQFWTAALETREEKLGSGVQQDLHQTDHSPVLDSYFCYAGFASPDWQSHSGPQKKGLNIQIFRLQCRKSTQHLQQLSATPVQGGPDLK